MNDLLKLESKATRRGFLKTTGAATLVLASSPALAETAETASQQSEHVRLAALIRAKNHGVPLPGRSSWTVA